MADQVVWFDMPVQNLDRAMKFYSAVLAGECTKQEMPGMTFAVLPHPEDESVSGCLVPCKQNNSPASEDSLLLYFNCNGRLDQAIALVEPNGGKVVTPKHSIGPYGSRAIVLDPEGNRIALHSR